MAQLSRLLGDASLRGASAEVARAAVAKSLERLADGLIAEAAASDDVFDHESAASYLEQRLRSLEELIDEPQRKELDGALRMRIENW